MRVDSYHARDTLSTLISLPLVFASSAFYDLARAPALLRAVAAVNPLSLMATAMRDAQVGAGVSLSHALLPGGLAPITAAAASGVLARTPLIAQHR